MKSNSTCGESCAKAPVDLQSPPNVTNEIMPAILEAKDVSKIYQMGSASVAALDHVSLAIKEGEFAAIQGTSGSGKSTLLNMLGGLDHPTSGDVFFAERPLGPLTKKEMARYRRFSVGMIFQNFNLVPTMSAAENVGLALAFIGVAVIYIGVAVRGPGGHL